MQIVKEIFTNFKETEEPIQKEIIKSIITCETTENPYVEREEEKSVLYDDFNSFSTHVSDFEEQLSNEEDEKNTILSTLSLKQLQILEKYLTYKLLLIKGPPGTGKTSTILEIIHALSNRSKDQILVVSPSNSAADNIAEKLNQIPQFSDKKFLRIYGEKLEDYYHFSKETLTSQPYRLLSHFIN